jgi:hypothetical protein
VAGADDGDVVFSGKVAHVRLPPLVQIKIWPDGFSPNGQQFILREINIKCKAEKMVGFGISGS